MYEDLGRTRQTEAKQMTSWNPPKRALINIADDRALLAVDIEFLIAVALWPCRKPH